MIKKPIDHETLLIRINDNHIKKKKKKKQMLQQLHSKCSKSYQTIKKKFDTKNWAFFFLKTSFNLLDLISYIYIVKVINILL